MNVYAKFRCAPLRVKKALGIYRELITTTRRRRRTTTRVAFWTRLRVQKFRTKIIAAQYGMYVYVCRSAVTIFSINKGHIVFCTVKCVFYLKLQ